ncbi:MAG TPA: anaerobic ribonucleoside-triphosphate reductase activating protein [Smithella sp.]|nr:anaerobic ribonucleoside-triphosphate reductase activating protein [Smithella sp.]MDM7986132.1 anaerobic ribonucleoside-triphosphate reductase activating protein [Smithella sp.]HNY48972.1 anaerobic ribonucleoside-triphosphate reductase activating protein [Smithella sp.]HOG89056.1 anaerobic ribonucleoside-triphosphate reductase activating protein [Smithella sp.]HOU49772.1 anaerobic ribonucleoside-triphosphate reductase activating protein [Smithella sp.]
MKIGGLQRISLIDYPGMICAIVFLEGCNFRCPYCHNPELVDPCLFRTSVKESDVLEFLKTRKGKLDAVSITGGEPTMQANLPAFIRKIRRMGFAVKLDTNGSHPHVIKNLLTENLLDYIAMDVKAPFVKYKEIVNAHVNIDLIRESIDLILRSKIPCEFRTTIIDSQLDEADVQKIADLISGADHYVLQKFAPTKTLDNKFLKEKSWSDERFQNLKMLLGEKIPSVIIR